MDRVSWHPALVSYDARLRELLQSQTPQLGAPASLGRVFLGQARPLGGHPGPGAAGGGGVAMMARAACCAA